MSSIYHIGIPRTLKNCVSKAIQSYNALPEQIKNEKNQEKFENSNGPVM